MATTTDRRSSRSSSAPPSHLTKDSSGLSAAKAAPCAIPGTPHASQPSLASSVENQPTTGTATKSSRGRSNSKLSGTMNKLKGLFITESSIDSSSTHGSPTGPTIDRFYPKDGLNHLSSPPPPPGAVPALSSSSSAASSSHTSPNPNNSGSSIERRGSTKMNYPRFSISDDGSTHFHYLKTAKRQEKLTSMLKELIGGKKLRDEAVSAVPAILNPQHAGNGNANIINGNGVPAAAGATAPAAAGASTQGDQPLKPPSLMSSFVNQVKSGEVDLSATQELSFVEKYGRCHEIIGKGSFGIVRVAHKTDPSSRRELLYAVKEFKRRPQEDQQKYSKRLTSEFCISSSLHHPNIIETLDLLQDAKGDYCEVMEYCSGGDLYSLILVNGKLEYMEADCFFKQIVRGVNYMHDMGVTHRDLKPENILLTAHGAVKITDFGNGECFRMAWEKEIHLSSGLCGSAPYIAPEEFINDSKFDPRPVDIWAVGVIYMAMRTGRHLWRMAQADDEFYERYLEGRRDANGYEPIESLKRARCRNVIYSILDPVPSRRITGKQILQSEWGREIHICEAGEKGL